MNLIYNKYEYIIMNKNLYNLFISELKKVNQARLQHIINDILNIVDQKCKFERDKRDLYDDGEWDETVYDSIYCLSDCLFDHSVTLSKILDNDEID